MFAGHAAVALAARSRLPRHSLGWLFAATYLIDLMGLTTMAACLVHARSHERAAASASPVASG